MLLTTFYHCARGASFKIYPLTFEMQNKGLSISCNTYKKLCPFPEVEFVHAVTAGGSVKFVASSVNFSIFTHFLCFFLLKLLKLGEIDCVKF